MTYASICVTFITSKFYFPEDCIEEDREMPETLYEKFHEQSSLGISYAWYTTTGGHHPLHWHDEVELLFPLSGKADIVIDGTEYDLKSRHLLVVESGQIHSSHSDSSSAMFLCIHFSKKKLREYIPDIESLRIRCISGEIPDEKFDSYLEICRMLDGLTRLYIKGSYAFNLEADGVILQTVAKLFEHFSVPVSPGLSGLDATSMERIHKIISYVEEHFREQISLSDAADLLGYSREYFCRFFRKNMGLSFFQYINEIRISHIYYDLIHTDQSIFEIMENNGFTNQKLFNKTFKKLYGCTPSEARKRPKLDINHARSSLAHAFAENK